jgi:hypothetical protein
MLPNERFALECRAYYDEIGLVVDRHNGEFAHCPYPEGMGGTGYYLLHDHHQQQGILQSKDVGRLCVFSGYAKRWLMNCDPFPADYFELWDIYEKYVSLHSAKLTAKLHAEKDENGKSLHSKKLHAEKDLDGKSLHAKKLGKAANAKFTKEEKISIGKKGGAAAKLVCQKKIELTRILDGEVFIFESVCDAARALNLSRGNLSEVCLGNRFSVSGFLARYWTPYVLDWGEGLSHLVEEIEQKKRSTRKVKGAKAGEAAKLVHQKKIELTRISDNGVFVFDAVSDAARALNLSPGNLSSVCLGKRKSTKGFTARYLT